MSQKHSCILAVVLACLVSVPTQGETFSDPEGSFTFTVPAGFIPMVREARKAGYLCMYNLPSEAKDEIPIISAIFTG